MSKFSFGADWDARGRIGHAVEELAEGRLPGKLGLLQQVVGHWAIPKVDRGLLRYGKAALDTLGSVMSYIESQKKVVDGGKDACVVWLSENGYTEAFPNSGYAFTSFVCGALCNGDFTKQTIRDHLGRPATSVLLAFNIGNDKKAYFIDAQGNSLKKTDSDARWSWDGPFVKSADHDQLVNFIRESIWSLMGTQTLRLACDDSYVGEKIEIAACVDDFDFCSGEDAHNDVEQLAQRCKSFIDTGRCRNLLFYGPPGTGKSTLARAIARELNRRVVIVEHDAIHRMSGSAYRIIGLLRPGVLVLNDVDRGGRDDNIALLQALEREHRNHPLLTCLTVNDITQLDPAILRPGRVHETREIPEPGDKSRKLILDYYVKKFKLKLPAKQAAVFLSKSKGFSPADTREFCETALAVGVEIALQEIDRINNQRKLYAGDRCKDYNNSLTEPSTLKSKSR